MFIVVRVRWTATPVADVWSDDAMRAWLDPSVQWSLAHCWSHSSFRQLTLNPYYLAPVVEVSGDPRKNPSYKDLSPRDALTQGVMDNLPPAVIADNAEAIASGQARFIFCFAQMTDLYGTSGPRGGVPTGHAVCDVLSPFASICQEVGHAYGFDHELADNVLPDGRYESYGSPYSFMSALSGAEHIRPIVADLPVGPPDPSTGVEPQRLVGPQLAVAHLHVKSVGEFPNPQTCLTANYAHFEHQSIKISIHSVDAAIAAWPAQKLPALIFIPHTPVDDRAYYIEFRAKAQYDSAISGPAVVMHSFRRDLWDGDFRGDRLVFEGAVVAGAGDADLKSRSGAISIKPHFDLAASRAVIQIGKGDAFPAAISLSAGPDYETAKTADGAWRPKYSRPCPFDKGSTYNARPTWQSTVCRASVTATGFNQPEFRFYLGGQELTAALGNSINVNTVVDVLDEPSLESRTLTMGVPVSFAVAGNSLVLETSERCNGSLTVGVSVQERGVPGTLQMRNHLFEFGFRNAQIEWDEGWLRDVKNCLKKRPLPAPDWSFPWRQEGPRPNWRENVLDVLKRVDATNPALAQVVVNGLNANHSLDAAMLRKLNARWRQLR